MPVSRSFVCVTSPSSTDRPALRLVSSAAAAQPKDVTLSRASDVTGNLALAIEVVELPVPEGIEAFLSERIEVAEGGHLVSSDAWDAWQIYRVAKGYAEVTRNAFSAALSDLAKCRRKSSGRVIFDGIALRV
jgi:hypothetical protein